MAYDNLDSVRFEDMREYPFDIDDKVRIRTSYLSIGEVQSIHSEISRVQFLTPQGKSFSAFIPNELLELVKS